MEMSGDREQLMKQHSMEKDEMISKFTAERESLNAEIANALHDRDMRLMEAEHSHQEVIDTHVHLYRGQLQAPVLYMGGPQKSIGCYKITKKGIESY